MDLAPWNPWEQFEKIQREINRTLDAFCRQLGIQEPSRPISFVPVIDLWETEAGLILVVELPGVLEEDVDVSVSPTRVVVRGLRAGVPRGRAHIQEWRWGEFCREVELPAVVDPKTLRASFSEGILEIHLARQGGS